MQKYIHKLDMLIFHSDKRVTCTEKVTMPTYAPLKKVHFRSEHYADNMQAMLTSIPNNTTLSRIPSQSECKSLSTSGTIMLNRVFGITTRALLMSMSSTVFPNPRGYCSVTTKGIPITFDTSTCQQKLFINFIPRSITYKKISTLFRSNFIPTYTCIILFYCPSVIQKLLWSYYVPLINHILISGRSYFVS